MENALKQSSAVNC